MGTERVSAETKHLCCSLQVLLSQGQISSSLLPRAAVQELSDPPFDWGREGKCWVPAWLLGLSRAPLDPPSLCFWPPQPRLVPERVPHSCSRPLLLLRAGCVPQPTPRPAVCQSPVLALGRLGCSLPGRAVGCSAALPCKLLWRWGTVLSCPGSGQIQNELLSMCAV